jgi:pimeloyl-ACP methyl ester carboxylesterase
VVLCVPGAGGFPLICETLAEGIQEQGLPLATEPFEWTHGYLRVLSDHLDTEHICCQAHRLAGRIAALKQECPTRSVSVLAHSAGCMVCLEAARLLPPNSLNHMILLAPAVSAEYDLRPALACAAGGVDVFYSRRDWWALGLGIAVLGTADRRWEAAAGRVGFQPEGVCPGDEALFARLRQHPWDWCMTWAGNWGGHYGAYRPTYLRAYVLPLLRDCG